MSQRLPGISDEEAIGQEKDILDAATLFLGRASNLIRIVTAHSPDVARWLIGFIAAVRQPDLGARSDVRLRGLANIKTSMTNECTYCATHTSIYGRALGLTDADLEALKGDAYRTSTRFNEKEKAVIAWAEAMTRNTAARDKKVWEDMRRLFNDTEIVEISLACAMFNMINRLNDSFWTELESEEYNRRQGNAVSGRTVEQIEAYAAGFPASGAAARARRQTIAAE
jgi:alkylhydroperoxidase family enzyme